MPIINNTLLPTKFFWQNITTENLEKTLNTSGCSSVMNLHTGKHTAKLQDNNGAMRQKTGTQIFVHSELKRKISTKLTLSEC